MQNMLASSASSEAMKRTSCSPKARPSAPVAIARTPSVTSVRRRSRWTIARACCPAVRRVGSSAKCISSSSAEGEHPLERDAGCAPMLALGESCAAFYAKRRASCDQLLKAVGKGADHLDQGDHATPPSKDASD